MRALASFSDPATGAPRLASGSEDKTVRVWDPVTGGTALLVLEGHSGWVTALVSFSDPATGAPRLASGSQDETVRVWDPVAGGAALLVLEPCLSRLSSPNKLIKSR